MGNTPVVVNSTKSGGGGAAGGKKFRPGGALRLIGRGAAKLDARTAEPVVGAEDEEQIAEDHGDGSGLDSSSGSGSSAATSSSDSVQAGGGERTRGKPRRHGNRKPAGRSRGLEREDTGGGDTEYVQSITIQSHIPEAVNNELLQRYIDIERDIGNLERKNAQQTLALKQQQLQVLNAAANKLELKLNEGDDGDGVDQADGCVPVESDAGNDTDGATYSKQEAAEKELDTVNQQKSIVEQEIEANREFANKLSELKRKRKQLLTNIFGKHNGSDQDYQLEFELDMLLERRQRIFAAKYRWQNGKLLVQHAISQLAFSVRKWRELRKSPAEDEGVKRPILVRIRNNMIAAVLNLQSSQRYLNTITFPYCTPDEMETLRKAIDTMFKDIDVSDSEHAQQLYMKLRAHAGELIRWIEEIKEQSEEGDGPARPKTSMHSWQKQVERYYQAALYRAVALKQWMAQVISTIIQRDLKTVSKRCSEIQAQLRAERIRLIQDKTRQQAGGGATGDTQPVTTSDLDDIYDIGDEQAIDNDLIEAEIADLLHSQDDMITSRDASAPTPLPQPTIAPLPDEDAILNVQLNEIKKETVIANAKFEREKERQERALRNKIDVRRSQQYDAKPAAVKT